MARYVQGNKWWEITIVDKKTVSTKWGKDGGSTSMRDKDHPDAATARADHDKQIAERVKQGFAPAGATSKKTPTANKAETKTKTARSTPAKGNTDLERAIIADPDDPEPYLVYADFLDEQGDPHGELIVLHTRKPAGASARIRQHTAELEKAMTWPPPETFKLGWQFGFIKRAEIRWAANGEQLDAPPDGEPKNFAKRCEAMLATFLRDPRARFIQELALGPVPGTDMMSTDSLATAIENVGMPCLRSFDISQHGFWDLSSTSAALPASSATPALRELVIHAGMLDVPKNLDWPHLTSAVFRTGSLGSRALKNICGATWPNLETLEIWFGEPRYGGDCTVKGLAAIFAGTKLGKVKHLKLMNCAFADDIAKALPKAKILAQLETLDLSMGNLSDAGVAAMAAKKDAFAHLARLNVSDNALTEASTPLLRGLAKKVMNIGTHDPERANLADGKWGRYVSVGE